MKLVTTVTYDCDEELEADLEVVTLESRHSGVLN